MTRKYIKAALPIGLLTLAGFGIAFASPKADLNRDNVISLQEFTQTAGQKFDAADSNADGFLDKTERQVLRANKKAERQDKKFGRIDKNSDGFISRGEMKDSQDAREAKRKTRRMEQLDTDRDGTISTAEREVAQADRQKRRKMRKSKKRGKFGKRGARLDSNADGLVSRAEFTAGAERMFARMDANSDGILEKGERRKRKGKRRR